LAYLYGALLLDPAISIGQSFSGITPMPIARDFCVVATVTFQILYVLVVMETRFTPNYSLQRDRPSDRSLDPPTVP
jgi:hypothetical protein